MRAYLVAWLVLLSIFLGLRVWGLPQNLEVYADIGRDNWVLYEWQLRGIPPLLGPQTSVLPVNQSAIYFYMLYPAFRLLNGWIYHSQVTLLLWYIGWFGLGAYLVRRQVHLRWAWFLMATLLCFQPQVILQNRFVWNPSFLPPIVAMSGLLMWQLQHKWRRQAALGLGGLVALAVSLSFSALPWMLATAAVAIWQFKKRSAWVLCGMLLGLGLLQLPTLVFELRHDWLITRAVLAGNFLPQVRSSLFEKTYDFLTHLSPNLPPWAMAMGVLGILVLAVKVWLKRRRYKSEHSRGLKVSLAWLLLTILLTLPSHVPILAHYIFPLLVSLLWVVVWLPRRVAVVVVAVVCLIWLSPSQLASYFVPAHRTVAELQACAATYCQQQTAPLFVSVQAGFHLFHNGPEFRYFFRRAGCQVKEIETAPGSADLMAVVVDSSTYQHGQTAYHELTLFGASTPSATLICQPGRLEVITLQRF